jgi:hypothetical protein
MSDFYSSEDVQQILREASILQQGDPISRKQLLDIATEVGLSPEVLHQAEQAWLHQQQVMQQQTTRQARARLGFQLHLIPYIAGSVLLVLLNLATTPRIYWSLYPIVGWGMGVTMHAACVYRKGEVKQSIAL